MMAEPAASQPSRAGRPAGSSATVMHQSAASIAARNGTSVMNV
jgi:hypothetical protein